MKKQHSGAAVITAMLIVALAATAASFMMWQNHLWLRQVENLDAQAQTRWTARAAINWGQAVLEEDAREVDHSGEKWAAAPPPFVAEGGEVAGTLSDAQGRFNLNNLVRNGKISQGDVVLFTRLLVQLELNPNLVNALVDWLDQDSEVSHPGGAEDMNYLALDPPYRAANRALQDTGELHRVQGFTPESIARLTPFVTALPEPVPINVNTAPAEVLAALCAGLTLTDAKKLVERRSEAHFKDRADFRKLLPDGIQVRDEDYNVASSYFIATVRTRQDRVQATHQALLERNAEGKTRIVWLKQIEE